MATLPALPESSTYPLATVKETFPSCGFSAESGCDLFPLWDHAVLPCSESIPACAQNLSEPSVLPSFIAT